MANKLQSRSLDPSMEFYGVEAATTIEQGDIVMINAAGFAVPGATATGQICVGISQEKVVNSGAAGSVVVNVFSGVFEVTNDAGDLLLQADVGRVAYITNASSVSKTSAGKSKAGTVRGLVAGGKVRVDLGVGSTAS